MSKKQQLLLFHSNCLKMFLFNIFVFSLTLASPEKRKSHVPVGFGVMLCIYLQCFPKFRVWAAGASGCRREHHLHGARAALRTRGCWTKRAWIRAHTAEHRGASPHGRDADPGPRGTAPAHGSPTGRADLPSAAFISKPQKLASCGGE